MTKFTTLKLAHEDFTRIMEGKKWVGRVYKTANGFGARVGQGGDATIVDGYSSVNEAFYEVTSRKFGYESLADRNAKVAAHNAVVRAKNKETRARAQYAFEQMTQKNFEPMMKIFGI